MVNYQNGKIYKIISLSHIEEVYYGSTCIDLSKRMTKHRAPTNTCVSKKIIDYGDAKIYLVENYPCNNIEELNKREGYYHLNYDCINKQIAGRTQKEYYKQNKDYLTERRKKYYEENKDEIKDYKDKYFKDNKKEILEKCKKYYNDNKEKIIEKAKIKYICDCGSEVSICKKARHEKTKKHIDNLIID